MVEINGWHGFTRLFSRFQDDLGFWSGVKKLSYYYYYLLPAGVSKDVNDYGGYILVIQSEIKINSDF